MTDGPKIQEAAPGHFDAVHTHLLQPLNPGIGEPVWRRLFDQPWAEPGDPLGYVLESEDKPVGYVGLVHGRVPRPDGGRERVCNLTTWVVDPEHRHLAGSLILPSLRLADTTLTSLTNIPAVAPILGRLGFAELETTRCHLLPVPLARSPWGEAEVLFGFDEVRAALPEWEAAIAEDHATLAEHVLVRESGGRHCYLMFTRGRWRKIPTARVQWVTPDDALEGASVALRRALLRVLRLPIVELDGRFVADSVPGAARRAMAVPRMYRSSRLGAPEVPNAYTELVLLGL